MWASTDGGMLSRAEVVITQCYHISHLETVGVSPWPLTASENKVQVLFIVLYALITNQSPLTGTLIGLCIFCHMVCVCVCLGEGEGVS